MNTSLHLIGEGLTPERQAEAVKKQREWLESVACGIIKRGVLPEGAWQREAIGGIILDAASQLHVTLKRKRGNPHFQRKVPRDDTVPLMVICQLSTGKTRDEAIGFVAERLGVDYSTIGKLYCKRRTALAWLKIHRLGAIRRE